jgi:hypothetical protein
MAPGFVGGQHLLPSPTPRPDRPARWQGRHADEALWLDGPGLDGRVFPWDTLCLVVQGYLRPAGSTGPLAPERAAEELRWRYLEEGTLDPAGLDGNAGLILLDAPAGQVLLYRPPTGTQPLYYRVADGGLLFAGNLAALVEAAGGCPRPNLAVAGAFLLSGEVPERETLFEGCYRLLPNELVCWTRQGLQRQFPTREPAAVTPSGGRAFEDVLTAVVADGVAARPRPANLLTGSPGSCALQTVLNGFVCRDELLPPTYSLCLDQPAAWKETERAVEASMLLGTSHRLVQPAGPVLRQLRDFIAETGELPGCADFALQQLAQALREDGVPAALRDAPVSSWPGEEVPAYQLLQQAASSTSLFNASGVDLFYPLFDSRLRPWHAGGWPRHRWLPWRRRPGLGRELRRLVPAEARRWRQAVPGLPLAEWLHPGGELRPVIERLWRDGPWPAPLPPADSCPPEVLYRAACFALWHETFIEGAWPREEWRTAEASAFLPR